MKTVTLPNGVGYWDCTLYPLGGCFRRAAEDMVVQVVSTFQRSQGANTYAKTQDNRKVAFDIQNTIEKE